MSYSAWTAALAVPHLQQQKQQDEAAARPSPVGSSLSIGYECSCRRVHPHLAYLFWCKTCSALQCHQCTAQQVDTYFCPSCLNSVFTTPAFANQNRCEQCVECPSCCHILSPMQRAAGQCALVCEYCRWTSEDYTPPTTTHKDETSSTAAAKSPLVVAESNLLSARIKEAEQSASVHASFQALLGHYRSKTAKSSLASKRAGSMASMPDPRLFDEFDSLLAASDAANPLTGGSGATTTTRGPASSTADRTESAASTSPAPHAELSNVARWMAWRDQREELMHQQQYVLPTQPIVNQFEPIPLAFLGHFDEDQSVEDLSTLPQRLAHPAGQHLWSHSLLPRRKALSTKLAHRCRTCHKFLVKPGPGASKPTMEIHMAAVTNTPTVTIGVFRPMRVDKSTSIILYFKNPLEKSIRLWITLPTDAQQQEEATAPTPVAALQPASRSWSKATCEVDFIRASTTVSAYDDLLEETTNWQDEANTPQAMEAEPLLVVFRQLSKVGLLMHVTPTTHEKPTHFVLLVHMQTEAPPAAEAESAAAAAPAESVGPITTFPLHINLGFAQP